MTEHPRFVRKGLSWHRLVATPTALAFLLAARQVNATSDELPAAPPAVSSEGVFVELRTDDSRVRIERVMSNGSTVPICLAPCRQTLDHRATYVIGGVGLVPTSQFMLPQQRQDVVLTVKPGSWAYQGAGLTLLALGLAAMVVGYMGTGDRPEEPDPMARTKNGSGWWLAVGLGGMGVGALGALMFMGSRTQVQSNTGSAFSGSPPARPRTGLALTARGLEF